MRHRPHSPLLALLVRCLVICFVVSAGVAHADPRDEARTHFKDGMKFYSAGDYKSAIKEFSSAQQLAPADINNYNLALCYDKLGDADPALQYYRAFLDKVPNYDKRAEIEASIARLDAASKSAAAKKAADDAKKADAAKPDVAKPVDTKPVDGDPYAAKPSDTHKPGVAIQAPPVPTPPAPTGVGSSGTPGSAAVVSTGDAQLDRVQSIDVDSIRQQRGSAGMDMRGTPYGANGSVAANTPPNAAAGFNGQPPPAGANAGLNGQPPPPQPIDQKPPQETPLYKKWWFYVILAAGTFVVIEIAASGSSAPNAKTGREHEVPLNKPGQSGLGNAGLTLLHF